MIGCVIVGNELKNNCGKYGKNNYLLLKNLTNKFGKGFDNLIYTI